MVDLCFQVFVRYIFLTFLSVYKKFVPPIEVFQISFLRGHLFFTYLFKAQEVNVLVSGCNDKKDLLPSKKEHPGTTYTLRVSQQSIFYAVEASDTATV